MDWQTTIKETGIFSIGTLIIALVVRSIINNKFNKDFEAYKIRFSTLHNDRLQIIKEFYSKLVKMELSMSSLMKPLQEGWEKSQKEKQGIAAKDANDFRVYYMMNKIVFPKELCELVDEINRQFFEAWLDFITYPGDAASYSPKEKIEKRNLWVKAWRSVSEEVPRLKTKIENEFRALLGV